VILYACEQCGVWQDISFAQELKKAWNTAMKSAPSAQIPADQGFPCPQGHGLMQHVTSQDRIYVRPATVESITRIEGEKE